MMLFKKFKRLFLTGLIAGLFISSYENFAYTSLKIMAQEDTVPFKVQTENETAHTATDDALFISDNSDYLIYPEVSIENQIVKTATNGALCVDEEIIYPDFTIKIPKHIDISKKRQEYPVTVETKIDFWGTVTIKFCEEFIMTSEEGVPLTVKVKNNELIWTEDELSEGGAKKNIFLFYDRLIPGNYFGSLTYEVFINEK